MGLSPLDAALDFADGIEIVADLAAVAGAELVSESRDVLLDPVEQAGAFAQRGAAVRDAAALAEEALENDARVGFGGERRRGG